MTSGRNNPTPMWRLKDYLAAPLVTRRTKLMRIMGEMMLREALIKKMREEHVHLEHWASVLFDAEEQAQKKSP